MSYPKFNTLEVKEVCDGAVLWVCFNRPKRLNSMSREFLAELNTILDILGRHKASAPLKLRVLVIVANGKGFCAGADMMDIGGTGQRIGLDVQSEFSSVIIKLREIPQVVITGVHGAVVGAGLGVFLASDFRIAASSARLSAPFAKLGLTGCDIGCSYFLPRLIGTARATEMLMLGRTVDAKTALDWGMVHSIVQGEGEEAKLRQACLELAGNLVSSTTPLGLMLTKDGLNRSWDSASLRAQLAVEDRQQVICLSDPECQEFGMQYAAKFLQSKL